jgi:hypothetical protein
MGGRKHLLEKSAFACALQSREDHGFHALNLAHIRQGEEWFLAMRRSLEREFTAYDPRLFQRYLQAEVN